MFFLHKKWQKGDHIEAAKNASNTWLKRDGEAKTLHSAISIGQLQKKRIMCLCITYFTYDMQHPVCTYLVWAKPWTSLYWTAMSFR